MSIIFTNIMIAQVVDIFRNIKGKRQSMINKERLDYIIDQRKISEKETIDMDFKLKSTSYNNILVVRKPAVQAAEIDQDDFSAHINKVVHEVKMHTSSIHVREQKSQEKIN
jgi:hypothetical protein